MHSEAQFARRAFKAGAAGYITKDSLPEELAGPEQSRGRREYVSPPRRELLMGIDGGVERESHERLSDREFEISADCVARRPRDSRLLSRALNHQHVSRENHGEDGNAELMPR